MAEPTFPEMGADMSGNFEGKKHAYRQTQDGIVVSFVVHPSDISSAIAMAPLGTRFMVAFAEIGDDENPIENDEARRVNDEIRLDRAVPDPAPTVPRPQANEAGISKPKQRFADLPLSQQAALRCEDSSFRQYLTEDLGADLLPPFEKSAAAFVRHVCRVESRSEFDSSRDSAQAWKDFERDYQNWLADKQYAGARR